MGILASRSGLGLHGCIPCSSGFRWYRGGCCIRFRLDLFFCWLLWRLDRVGAERRVAGAQSVMDGLLAAFPDAIHAGNTTAQVDAVRFRVDTRRFAVARAQAAAVAFAGVDDRSQQ